MNRGDFFKVLGIVAASPSILLVGGNSVQIVKWNPKRWPIYPDRVQFGIEEYGHLMHTSFSYVKINRNNTDYLIPLRETNTDENNLKRRFEYEAEQIKEMYQVDESNNWLFDNGLVVKYNPNIHNN
jgi:hypothetical protein